MRVNIQIIDGKTGGHIWARTFDGSFSNHLALQDKITESIADALSLRVNIPVNSLRRVEKPASRPLTRLSCAGGNISGVLTREDLRDAVSNFEEAVELDQQYSRAYAALAMIYVSSALWRWPTVLGVREDEAITKARSFLTLANEHPTTLSRQATRRTLGYGIGNPQGL